MTEAGIAAPGGAVERTPPPRADWALFLDIDGSLLDIAATPQDVIVAPEVREILADLAQALDGAVALLSGRPLRDIDRLFAPLRLPAAGQHGAEIRRLAGGERAVAAAPALDSLRRRLSALADEHPGVLIEDKGASLTAHYRLAPGCGTLLRDAIEHGMACLGSEYELLESKMAFDVKPRRFTKGSAVAEFMRRPPFAGRRPVVVGDDITDLDGFAVALRGGGCAIQIGPRPAGPGMHFLSGPPALRTWLATLPRAIAASRQRSADRP